MSFLAPKIQTPAWLDTTEADRQSNWSEAKPVPFGAGNDRRACRWLCQPTEPLLTETGKTHQYYHVDIAGHFGVGPWDYVYQIYINGKVAAGLNYYRSAGGNPKVFTLDLDGGLTDVQTTMTLYWGTETQTADSTLNGFHSGETHPAYRGQVYAVFENLPAGEFDPVVPNVEISFRRFAPWTHDATEYDNPTPSNGVHPISAIIDLLTHPRGGLGMDQDAVFNMDQLLSTYSGILTDATANFPHIGYAFISPRYTERRAVREYLAQISTYIDGFYKLKDGLIEVNRFPQETPTELSPSQYTELSQHDFTDDPDIEFPNTEEWLTGVAVAHYDINREHKKTTLPVNSPFMRKILGETRVEEIDRTWLFYPEQAQVFGDRYLTEINTPTITGVVRVRKAKAVHPDNVNVDAALRGTPLEEGDVFKFDYAPRSLDLWVRITRRREVGDIVELSFTQEHGTHPLAYEPPADPVPELTLPEPPAFDGMRFLEAPYELYRDDRTAIIPLYARADKSVISVDVSFGEDATFDGSEDGFEELTGFAVFAELDESVADTTAETTFQITATGPDVSALLADQVDDAALDGKVLVLIANELMSLKSVTPLGSDQYDITVLRAQFGTDSDAYSATADVWIFRKERSNFLYHQRFQEIFDGSNTYQTSLAELYFTARPVNYFQSGDWETAQLVTLVDRKPGVPTDLTLTPSTESIIVELTAPSDVDLYTIQIQWDTEDDFSGEPYSYGFLARPGETVSYTIRKYKTGGNLVKLESGLLLYVRALATDRSGNSSDNTAAVSARTRGQILDIPDFSAYGKVGGSGDIRFELNKNSAGASSPGTVRIIGSRYVDSAGTVYPVYGPTDARSPLRSGSMYPDQTLDFDGSELDCPDGSMFVAHINTDAIGAYPLADLGGTEDEAFFVVVEYYKHGPGYAAAWIIRDGNGDVWTLPSGYDPHIIAKIEREPGAAGLTKIVPYFTQLEAAQKNELEFDTLADVKAYAAASVATIASGAKIRWKGREAVDDGKAGSGVWDNTSTDTEDGGSIHKFTAVTTGRIKSHPVKGPYVDVRDFGAKGDFDWQYWRNSTYANVAAQTDDTAAIQAAIDYAELIGGKVYIPAGIYRITATLVNKLRPVDIIGDRRVIPVGDMALDQTIDRQRGTILIRHVDPGDTSTPAITDYFPIIWQRGAINSGEWNSMSPTGSGAWNDGSNLMKHPLISGITFDDVRSGSDYSIPSYGGSDHFAAAVLWQNVQHGRIEWCQFTTRGRGIEGKWIDDCYIRNNFFNCGWSYNVSKAYANSTGAIYLHREKTNEWKKTNTLDISENLFEGNSLMDLDIGGDGTDGEIGDTSALQIKDNFFKQGGNDYYRTRRGRFYRINADGRTIELMGQLKTSLGSSEICEEMWYFEQLKGGRVVFGPCTATDANNAGLSDIQCLARFVNCTIGKIPVINPNFEVGGKFTGQYLIEVDDDSREFIQVEDNPDWTDGLGLTAKRIHKVSTTRLLAVNPGFSRWAEFDTANSPQIPIKPAGNWASIGTGDFSMECWQYVPSTNLGSANIGLWRCANTSSQFAFDNGGFSLVILNTTATLQVSSNLGARAATSDKTVDAGMHHFVVTRTGTTIRVYMDGEMVIEDTESNWGTTVPTAAMFAGTYGTAHNLGGRLARFKLYGHDLSAIEVLELFSLRGQDHAGFGYAATEVICDLEFAGAGNFFRDLSGNKMHGWATDYVSRNIEDEVGAVEHTTNFTFDQYFSENFSGYINEVPAGFYIEKIFVKNNGTGTSNLNVENGSGGNLIVNTVAIGSGYNDEVTLNLPKEPSTAAARLYVNGSNWTNQDFNVRVIIRKFGA